MKEYLQILASNLLPSGFLILKFSGLDDYKKIIDLGCGKDSVLKKFNKSYKLGVDIFDDYIQISKSKNIHNEYMKLNLLDDKVTDLLNDFEAAICFDVLEHMEEDEAINFIKKIEDSKVKFIAFRTPSVFVEQNEYDANPFQIHKSALSPKFFIDKGYKVYGEGGPLFIAVDNGKIRKTSLLEGIFSYLLRPIFFFFPEKSLNFIAIKIRN